MTDQLRPITEVGLQAMRDALERTRSQHSPEDHAGMAEAIEFLAELRAMVSEYDGDDEEVLDESFFEQALRRARTRVQR